MFEINNPQVLAEVQTMFIDYEAALMRNDVEALIRFFWQSPFAVRYGATENLYGWEQIVTFRKQRPTPPARTLSNTVITTFGEDYANTNTEFSRTDGVMGRQSQSWIKTAQGWKIVSAHISFIT